MAIKRVQPRSKDGRYGFLPPKPPTAAPSVPIVRQPEMIAATPLSGWSCRDCHTTDPALFYPSGKIKNVCVDCYRYKNMLKNAARVRRDGTVHSVNFTQEDFITWRRLQPEKCSICGVAEKDLYKLGLKSSTGHLVRALGVDRKNSDRGYELDNIQMCCFGCNKAKGNVFSDEEMKKHLSPAIAKAWEPYVNGTEHDEPMTAIRFQFATVELPASTCDKCGYSAPKAAEFCVACYKYKAVVQNANKQRFSGFVPGLEITAEEFATWYGHQRMECHYCQVPEAAIPFLGAKTQQGHALQRLGIDRIDSSLGYSTKNMVLACYPCNKAKGNTFTEQQARDYLGPGISKVWKDRLWTEAEEAMNRVNPYPASVPRTGPKRPTSN